MRITKTEKGLAIEVPADVAEELGLKDGDDVDVEIRRRSLPPTAEQRAAALEKLRSLAKTFPADFKFDREEAHARR